ncbi:MAG: hypothetical protein HRT58_18410 [Crocinitomicaceae bacterium]|nr:hypothetical protein [Flavobacteriales bacterium]NQZ37645.1 hypothetical protein [Crocinitomicaceae bacterium]
MKRSFVVLFGFCVLFLTSCMDLETSKQLETIASLNQTLDSIETVFNEHPLDSIAKISLSAYGVENRIKKHYHSDTINMEFGRKMDAFKVMRRTLKPLRKSITLIPESIESERLKLKELKADIENGDGKREKYAEYITFEEVKVSQLRILLNEYIETRETSLNTYNDLYDELYDFSMSLLKK